MPLFVVSWVTLLAAACWVGIVSAILAVLTVAKRADAAGEPPEVRATSERLGRLVLDVRGALGVERVAIVMHERAAPGFAVIVACCGCPELVGSRVRVDGGFGWGPGAESRFLVEPPGHWSVVSVPIAGPSGLAGTLAVATSRERGISALEVSLLERMTARAAGAYALTTGAPVEDQHRHLA